VFFDILQFLLLRSLDDALSALSVFYSFRHMSPEKRSVRVAGDNILVLYPSDFGKVFVPFY
jgi:hypothetical protein